ncbi:MULTISPECIES: GNAT family N-acetyltransferase [Nocardia]|uniref:GNAT family N-acetyltransferase n=1 Tax=Nocardia TaxID=1817 RepID=UPI000BF0AA5D|nr:MULTISPECIES: GNAT family N-acetyltransferase [Nocardia]MBF6070046.1 GNAT family N-acetyltransferase [Nocardia farcinica]MBF6188288.1 GNAT family N-acetyltransferase [Nocardia farcinica]MBF6255264.1 GNAT family N-acetyltransferase [Nocardia farcinica]MBF6270907.1 GNAT family N-acetyltransferase [Nocardia farcinica]MBF6290976.1 GNAT family N-acetyltransferase [Nocardia farcinica]
MSTSVTALTLDGLDKLPAHARRCVFWEIDPAVAADSHGFSDPVFEKEAWLSTVMLEWGSCGQVAHVDGKAAGCALYSPPTAVPRATLFPTSPVSPDAILLTTLCTEPAHRDDDIAHRLLQAVVSDLVRRGVRALEAFGIRSGPASKPLSDRIAGSMRLMERIGGPVRGKSAPSADCSPETCMIEADLLEDFGFEVVAPHHRFPRLRLELDSDHGWKEDVERALDQLLAAASLTVPTRAGAR